MAREEHLLDALNGKALLCDGAMGTLLLERGADDKQCLEYLNISNPDMVYAIHQEYLQAGADIIQTNTFGANKLKLAFYGLENEVLEINRQGVRLALRAANSKNAWVLGSVGPIGLPMEPVGVIKYQDVYEAYREQVEVLSQEGVDAIILETMNSIREAEAAISACKDVCQLPVICQFSLSPDGHTVSGEDLSSVIKFLAECRADIVGLNCGCGPSDTLDHLKALSERIRGKKFLSVQPNAGFPQIVQGRLRYTAGNAYFASYTKAFMDLGANIIGGCCGTTPIYISAMRRILDGSSEAYPVASTVKILNDMVSERKEYLAKETSEDENILTKLKRKFVITVEMDPPKGTDIQKTLKGAALLKRCNVDAINIADSPMARVRVSPVALAHRIKKEIGLDTILHFTCRDRNLIGIQSELLGAAILGINNVLALTGDPPNIGDHPKATGVFDITSEGLVYILNALNHGKDYMGNPLTSVTNFAIGVAVNPNADDLDTEIQRLKRKIENGAHFVQTQPIYHKATIERLLDRLSDYNIPIIMGLLPLRSYKHAEFLHNEVPGIFIPEAIRDRMRTAGDDAAAEGVAIASELIEQCRDMVSGVYIMPPFDHYEMVEKIIEKTSLQMQK